MVVLHYGAVTGGAVRGACGGVSGRSLCGEITLKAAWRTGQSGADGENMEPSQKR